MVRHLWNGSDDVMVVGESCRTGSGSGVYIRMFVWPDKGYVSSRAKNFANQ